MNEQDVENFIKLRLVFHGLLAKGWTYEITDVVGDNYFGYTNFEKKVICISRYEWPTTDRNIQEVIHHEIAHALVGHGDHNLEWWDKLIEIGGRGVWVWDHDGSVEQVRIEN